MSFIKKYLKPILVCLVVAAAFAISFVLTMGGEEAKPSVESEQKTEYIEQKQSNAADKVSAELPEEPKKNTEQESIIQASEKNTEAKDSEDAETKEINAETKASESKKEELVCTISISCKTVLSNMDSLKAEKVVCVPENGVVLEKKEVVFSEGETVFDILKRETRNAKIHMEFVETPAYKSAYIEGINNLYEFDCGELSGWMYRVNGESPNVGCSAYAVKNGDEIEWLYTCNMGRDLRQQ